MYIGKVIGTVVSTVKISHLEGRTLLLVDQLDLGGKETGAYDIAVPGGSARLRALWPAHEHPRLRHRPDGHRAETASRAQAVWSRDSGSVWGHSHALGFGCVRDFSP
jgi:hypothetical protein